MKMGALLILAGLGCFLAFNLVGSTLDAQGMLHEPFALLPLGNLLIFMGLGLGLLPALRSGLRRGRAKGD